MILDIHDELFSILKELESTTTGDWKPFQFVSDVISAKEADSFPYAGLAYLSTDTSVADSCKDRIVHTFTIRTLYPYKQSDTESKRAAMRVTEKALNELINKIRSHKELSGLALKVGPLEASMSPVSLPEEVSHWVWIVGNLNIQITLLQNY